MQRLSAELRVRPEYFLRDPLAAKEPVFFRSLASTLTRDLNYQRAQMRWQDGHWERSGNDYVWIEGQWVAQ